MATWHHFNVNKIAIAVQILARPLCLSLSAIFSLPAAMIHLEEEEEEERVRVRYCCRRCPVMKGIEPGQEMNCPE